MSVSLEQQIAAIKPGDHFCSFYEDPSEQLAVTTLFVKTGLARGQRCVHIADDRTPDEIRRTLEAAGVDVAREQKRGTLRLVTKCDATLRTGEFRPEIMLELIAHEQARALADGFAGLWLSGEMTWALGKEAGCDRMIEFEGLLDRMTDLQWSVMLCQYNVALFGRTCIQDAVRTHSGGVLRADAVKINPGTGTGGGGDREELYRFLMENTRDVISLYSVEGRRVYVSPSARRLLGWVPAEPFDGVHPEDLPAVRQAWQRVLAGEDAAVTYRFSHANGSWRWLEVAVSLVPFRERPHVLAVSRDVTEKMQAWDALREREELLRLLTESTNDSIRLFNFDGDLVYVNRSVEGRLGEASAGLVGSPHPDDLEMALSWWERIKAGGGGLLTCRVSFGGSEWRWMESHGTVVRYKGRPHVLTVCREVTERKRAEEALRESAGHLQRLSRRLFQVQEEERRHLARELHDEFGQVLTGLRLLLKPNGEAPAHGVPNRLHQARSLVDQLLERVRGLSFDLRPAALDQLGLLPALLTLGERYTGQTGVQLDFKHQGVNGPFPAEAETAAYRVVQEALTNVARHAGVANVTVRVWAGEGALHVQIEDRGRGFDVDSVLAAPRSGGLVGMQERVQLLGGKLTIESRPGAGTQITAELPLPRPEGP